MPQCYFPYFKTTILSWFHLAYIETVKRALIADQTIEPTQVAGFNQFFDDFNGTKATRYGIGLDARLSNRLYSGVEVSRRDLEVPIFIIDTRVFEKEEYREDLYRAYLYWAPHVEWAVTSEYRFDKFEIEERKFRDPRPSRVDTISVPLGVHYFNPSGFFAKLGVTYVRQEVDLDPLTNFTIDSDNFVVVDAAIGYRLPKRWGIISFEGRNLLDEKFLYQDDNFRTSELIAPAPGSRAPTFIPDRTIFATLTLYF